MIRSGAIDGPLLYAACGDGTGDNGPVKWLPDVAAPWFLRIKDAKSLPLMIGYGPARAPAAQVDFVLATYGVLDSAAGGVWRYTAGTGYTKLTTPPGCDGWLWFQVLVHPSNTNRFYLLGCDPDDLDDIGPHYEIDGAYYKTPTAGLSPVWTSADAGVTWEEVLLPKHSDDAEGRINTMAIQEQSGDLCVVGLRTIGGAVFWRGQNATTTYYRANALGAGIGVWANPTWSQSGANGDILTSETDSPGSGTAGRLGYIPTGGWRGHRRMYGPSIYRPAGSSPTGRLTRLWAGANFGR